MAFAYTRAPTVAAGEVIKSTHLRDLAQAFIDRLKLGPSCPWRIVYYLLSAFRQIRNPDASGFLFPSQAEFFEFYQNLDPQNGEWPLSGPGDPEGVNVSSQMGAFVFGVDAADIYDESDRTTNENVGGIPLGIPDQTAGSFWILAKRQRGAIDIDTGAFGSPALQAAASHTQIRYSGYSPHGLAYGDFLASPESAGACSSGQTPEPLDYQIVFTRLDGSSSVTYGSCPENSGDLAGVAYTPWSYVLFFNDGTVTTLPILEWVEGPYTANPNLRKTQNGFLDRVVNRFAAEFRGGTMEENETKNNEDAFDFQRFLTTQYLLAPQRGQQYGDTVVPAYPQFIGTVENNLIKSGVAVGRRYKVHPDMVCASAYAEAHGLFAECTVKVYRDDVQIGTIRLTPDANFDATGQVIFRRPSTGGVIRFEMGSEARFRKDVPQFLGCEITELQDYKPNSHDLYLMTRVGGVQFSGATDGTGLQTSNAKEITDNYFARGCITALSGSVSLPGSLAQINNNAVFDVARRLSKCVRILNRHCLTSYAVINGKSVLYFNRYARGNSDIDLFDGIGPSLEPVSEIAAGVTYIVRGADAVVYNRQAYTTGQTFTGVSGITTFTGGGVYEYDGIRLTAPPGGMSNRWLMGLELKAYHPSVSSIWKPDAYGDYYPLVNRCLLCDPTVASDSRVVAHVNYGIKTSSPLAVLSPEAPDYLNYVPTPLSSAGYDHANQVLCGDPTCEEERIKLYKSCRLFEPWPEIESVTDDGNGNVTVTFTGRIHHHEDAPASISSDISTWDAATIETDEDYRTWENGIRQYLLWDRTGRNAPVTNGDESGIGTCQSFSDNPFASVIPHFLFVQLPGQPYHDGNDTYQSTDTPFWHDEFSKMELYLRAICEGFVDGVASADIACEFNTTDAFGFTFENLMIQATGGKWVSFLPSESTDYLPEAETRPEQPLGYGVLPNTLPSAEVFNQYSAAVNLLDTFRVMLPATLQFRTGTATGSRDATNDVRNGSGQIASTSVWTHGSNDYSVWLNATPPGVGSYSYTAWADATGATASARMYLTPGAGPTFSLVAEQGVIEWRWSNAEDSGYALPPEFDDMLTSSAAIIAEYDEVVTIPARSVVSGTDQGSQCHDASFDPTTDTNFNDGGTGANLFTDAVTSTSDCRAIGVGTLSSGSPNAAAVYAMDSNPDPNAADYCVNESSIGKTVAVVNTTTPLITVPLVDA